MIIGELTETYPPMQDGVGRVCWAYCETLGKMGHEAWYIAPDDPGHTRIDGLRTLVYKGVQIPGQNYRLGVPDWSMEFRKELQSIPFDILHIHSPFLSARIAQEIQKAHPEVPIVATFHSKYYDDFYKATHSKAIAQGIVRRIVQVYNQCDAVWTVNNETAGVLDAYGYKGKIDIISNGTNIFQADGDAVREMREKLNIPEGKTVLLFVGQIDRKKNIHSILRACAILKEKNVPFTLLLAGEGPDRGNLEQLASQLNLKDEARFLGFIRDGKTLQALYLIADLFVFPSVYDNAPMVVREAAAAGTPAVLVRESCAAEGLTDGQNGFLCENTPEDIAETIIRGIPNAKTVGENAKETIPQPWSEIMTDVVSRYEELIKRRKNRL